MDALAAGNELGGFFSLAVGARGDSWRPMADLVAHPPVMQARIEGVRAALAASRGVQPAAIEPRVAASLAHLALASRIVSPALAALASAQWMPALGLTGLRWQPAGGSPVPLSLDAGAGTGVRTLAEAVAAFRALAVAPALEPLEAAVLAVVPLSAHVLRGNTWSALAGALTPLRLRRPDLLPAARSIVEELLAAEPDAGGFDQATGRFRRATCCLYYRLPRGGLCGDCALDEAPHPAGR